MIKNKEGNSILKNVDLICGDALEVDKLVKDNSIDLLWSCPPYYDLEEYSDDPKDFANKEMEEFDKLMEKVVKDAVKKLKPNRFAVFVVGEVRGKDGAYQGLVNKTIQNFEKAGLKYYNEIILINSIGTLPLPIVIFDST